MKFTGTISSLELNKDKFNIVIKDVEKTDSVFGSADKGEININLVQTNPKDTIRIGTEPINSMNLGVGKKVHIEVNESTSASAAILTKENLINTDTKYTFEKIYDTDTINTYIIDIPNSMKADFDYLNSYSILLEVE